MRTKTRNAIAALIAALGIGLLAAQPAFSAKNDGRFQQSAEARRLAFCADLQAAYNDTMDNYNENPSQRPGFKRTAENLKLLAEGNNCSWAM